MQDIEIKYLPSSSVRGQQGSLHPVRRRGGPLASGVSASLCSIIWMKHLEEGGFFVRSSR